MRSLTSALQSRHDREGASCHRPGGRGCRDDHARRPRVRRERGHAARHQASSAPARSPGPDGAVRGRGRSRLRTGGPGDLRFRTAGERREVPARARLGRTPPGGPPRAIPGVTRARRDAGTRSGRTRPGSGPRATARRDRGRWSRGARRRTFRPPAGAEPHERVHARRPDRRTEGRPCSVRAGRPAHPGDPAHRRPSPRRPSPRRPSPGRLRPGRAYPGKARAGNPRSGRASRRTRPGPAAARLGWSPSAASRLPSGDAPSWSRPASVRPGRRAGAASRSPASAGSATSRPRHAPP
jgi:serine/arginine repetitive matrix protein 1